MRFLVLIISLVIILSVVLGCSSKSSNPVVTPTLNGTQSEDSLQRVSAAGNTTGNSYWSDMIVFDGNYWLAHKNEDGTINRAFGKGVKPSGTPEQIIDSHKDVFKVPSSSLLKVEEYTKDRIRYVFFRQIVDGIQIKDSRVELRYARNGNLILVGADVFPGISIDAKPLISSSDAVRIASSDAGQTAEKEDLVIEKHGDDFHLVWWVDSVENRYHIDAHSGSILEVISNKVDEHSWDTNAEIYPLSPSTPAEIRPYPNQLNQVDIPGSGLTDVIGNKFGKVSVASEEPTLAVNSFTRGPWANPIACDNVYPDASIAWQSENGKPQSIQFDSTNSNMGQRMVGYWANVSHDYIKAYDPTFTGMDFPLDTYADCCCTCNAFAYIEPPFHTVMYSANGGCVATSEVSDVIVHEYGHIYVAAQYTLGNPPLDLHEGWADYLGNTITNQPEIGKDITGPGTNFRSSVNTVQFDNNNCGWESHCMGNIYAGALWEIRSVLGAAYTDHVWHQARYAQSSSIENYVVDFYMVDDDDDNVLNGTPNKDLFNQCFWDNHHIPVPAMPDIPTTGVTIDAVPIAFPLQMDNDHWNNLRMTVKIRNLDDQQVSFQAWTAVEMPSGSWYGPMIPPSIRLASPVLLTLEPLQEVELTLRQSVPAFIPEGNYKYHLRIGQFADHVNDVLLDDGWIAFTMY